jgi:hypothetical protein
MQITNMLTGMLIHINKINSRKKSPNVKTQDQARVGYNWKEEAVIPGYSVLPENMRIFDRL